MKTFYQDAMGVLKEGLSLWKKYIETRQEAYERKMDKERRKCIEYAEQFIRTYYDKEVEEKDKQKYLRKRRDLFFKYNN